jgi:hypothetical protein
MNRLIIFLIILFLMLSVNPDISAQEAIPNSSRLGLLNWGNNFVSRQPWMIADLSESGKARTQSPVGTT